MIVKFLLLLWVVGAIAITSHVPPAALKSVPES
jgi:hypothetical protein